MSSKKHKIKSKQKPVKLNIGFSLPLDKKKSIIIISALFLAAAGLAYYYVYYAFSVNKENCFPLDDPWIHLTFARNLVEYGSYSYFKNEMVTAGSTSPVYTLLLAFGYIFIKNEYTLSFLLGMVSFAASAVIIYKLSGKVFNENWLGIAAAVIFALDKWLNFFACSGMETPLYIFFLLAAYYCYMRKNALLFGFMFGLTVWARPDAVTFVLAVIIDYLVLNYFTKKNPEINKENRLFSQPELIKAGIAFGVLIALYTGMNMILSGTVLPNTFSAKTAYYSAEFRSRTDFLKYEVWGYFTKSSYSLFIVPFFIGIIKIGYDIFKSRYNPLLLGMLFIVFLIFLYWYKLPFAAVKGRYMVPVIPFYILLTVYGTREFFKWLGVFINDKKMLNALTMIFFAAVFVFSAITYSEGKNEYAEQTEHIYIRNVAAAKWINENTPENSVIATHDIGAIAFYTRRKIVDVAGLVSPQFIPKLFDADFSKFMVEEMKRQNVSYIAFIKEWYQVVNENPLFQGGDNNSEIFTIYKFNGDKTHILSRDVNGATFYALGLVANKQVQQAQQVLNRLIIIDPASSYTYFILANIQYMTGDMAGSEKNVKKALDIFPDYREANIMLADIYNREKKPIDARNRIQSFLKNNPGDTTAVRLLNSIKDTTGQVNNK